MRRENPRRSLSWGALSRAADRVEQDDEESEKLLGKWIKLERGNWDCPICFNVLTSNVEAPCCGALFCRACICEWVERAVGRPRCPNCSCGLGTRSLSAWAHNGWAQRQADESLERRTLEDERESRAAAEAIVAVGYCGGRGARTSHHAAAPPPTVEQRLAALAAPPLTVEQRLAALEKASELTMRSCQVLLREKAQMAAWRREQRAFLEALATRPPASHARPERDVCGGALGAELRQAVAAGGALGTELRQAVAAIESMRVEVRRESDAHTQTRLPTQPTRPAPWAASPAAPHTRAGARCCSVPLCSCSAASCT